MQTVKNIFFYLPIKLVNISILGIIDSLVKVLFIKKTIKHHERLGKPYGVIINDNMLKFHDNDIRKQIKAELLKK